MLDGGGNERFPDLLAEPGIREAGRAEIAGPIGRLRHLEALLQRVTRDDRGFFVGRRNEAGSQVEEEAGLVHPGVKGDAFLFLLGIAQGSEGASPAAEDRDQPPEVDHAAPVGIPEEVRGLIEDAVVQRRAVHVHDEDPAEALFSELDSEVHVDGAKRRGADRIRPREHEMAPELVRSAGAEGELREDQDRPARHLRGDGPRELLGQAFAQDAVGVRGKIGAVLLENPAGEEHHGPLAIEGPDLAGLHLRHVAGLSRRTASATAPPRPRRRCAVFDRTDDARNSARTR